MPLPRTGERVLKWAGLFIVYILILSWQQWWVEGWASDPSTAHPSSLYPCSIVIHPGHRHMVQARLAYFPNSFINGIVGTGESCWKLILFHLEKLYPELPETTVPALRRKQVSEMPGYKEEQKEKVEQNVPMTLTKDLSSTKLCLGCPELSQLGLQSYRLRCLSLYCPY